MKRRFDSLGMDGELRKFQKATNSFRRKNIEDSDVEVESLTSDVCRVQRKNGNVKSIPRKDTKFFNELGDVDSTLDKEIQNLVYMSILHKYKQALGDAFADSSDNGEDVDEDASSYRQRLTELINKPMEGIGHDSEDNTDDKFNEGIGR